ncbi:hypothetical protein Scep_014158 [Stephania cephalantha]|uniref:Uncharacterized protein n=1 Tax=Stephania cephalantha TaxID=152367 RepID=A0AAP0J2R8_9MAGN
MGSVVAAAVFGHGAIEEGKCGGGEVRVPPLRSSSPSRKHCVFFFASNGDEMGFLFLTSFSPSPKPAVVIRGGFRRGFGGRGGRGDPGHGGRGGRRGGRQKEEQKWVPVTKLNQIVETLLRPVLKEAVMKIMPVQTETEADQQTRFKTFVVVGEGWDTFENGNEVEVHYTEK